MSKKINMYDKNLIEYDMKRIEKWKAEGKAMGFLNKNTIKEFNKFWKEKTHCDYGEESTWSKKNLQELRHFILKALADQLNQVREIVKKYRPEETESTEEIAEEQVVHLILKELYKLK